MDLISVAGGTGGEGGKGGKIGGNGGRGAAPQVDPELAAQKGISLDSVVGGTGGAGGQGGIQDGAAGVSEVVSINEPLLSPEETALLPDMSLDKFCQKYALDDATYSRLFAAGCANVADVASKFELHLRRHGLRTDNLDKLREVLQELIEEAEVEEQSSSQSQVSS
ncbi:hypothetical protein FB45DRAFT_1035671 [Roridomyces roridus]|uniref:Uncharacterized protein n=1 Tax=Roridomyces roridus TaxID=1738132 RepID=A0AAD7BAB7_9AGAR|nr:hypothetical protein FB45DRAFT_1035671 [Roridomyces roridus]